MDTARRTALPMFPLPDFFLFPGSLVPLYIFEERYRQMVGDQLDRAGRLVMASIAERHRDEAAGPPPVFPIGGLGEIVHHEPLPEGKFLIWVLGLGRVRIEEVPSDRLYRQVHVELLEDEDCDEHEALALRPLLLDALAEREVKVSDDPQELPVGALADVILQSLKLHPAQLERAFAETSAGERAKLALGWHLDPDPVD
jgi:Lon protease-like protein